MSSNDSSRPKFDALVGEFQPMVARICTGYERDRELARELVQDVWFAVWRALPNYRGEASLKTFVARIAQFRAVSHVAKRIREPIDPATAEMLELSAPPPEHAVLDAADRNRVLAAVQRLPLALRQPVILTLEDFSPAEIASLLGLSQNVVGVRLTRARTLLRTMLKTGDP